MTQPSADTPVRAHRCPPQLFADLREQSLAALQALLGRSLVKAGDWLSGMLAKPALARTASEAQTALRLGRPAFERAFTDHFARAFELLRSQVLPGSDDDEAALRLMNESELERLLAAESLVDALQSAHGPSLDTVAMRFAAMAGVKELRAAFNPLAPVSIGNALQVALRDCPLPAVLRTSLAKLYEQELVASLGVLLGELNARMASAGILPQLGGQFVTAETGDPLDEKPLGPYVPENRPGVDVRETFNEIRGLLHKLRPASPAAVVEDFGGLALPGGKHVLDAEEIITSLSRLQSEVPSTLMEVLGDPDADLVAGIKQEVIGGVPGLSRGDAADFDQEHEDAIDLVGMLFDVLFDERDFTDRARLLMARLVLPYTKAAMLDLRMFQYTTHPARRMLNSLAEALEGNRGEGLQESALLDKADAVVEALVTGFDRDLLLFEVLGRDLRVFLVQNRQRQALAERRASELQRGQEALERARARAAAELQQRKAAGGLPPALDAFLSGYWSHHLSIVALREGCDSEPWRATLAAADRLIDVARRGEARLTAAALAMLDPALRQILVSSGQVDSAAAEIIQKLADGMPRNAAPAPAAPATAAPADLPVEVPATTGPELVVPGLPDLPGPELDAGATEAHLEADLKALRALKIGDWIELVADDNRMQPVKYSWISPISLRLMFTNRKGVRMLVASVEELAAMKRKGELLLREHGQLFDHAIHRVKERLEVAVAKAA